MRLRLAAIAVFVVVCVTSFRAHAVDPLTLDDAFTRVAAIHPSLRLFGSRSEVLAAELDSASLRPPLVAGASIENAFGTGHASGMQSAEITLNLASALERGGKLDARRTLVQSRIDALAIQREAQRLDLLAEVARRYLAIIGANQLGTIGQLDIEQRQRILSEARKRLQAGASPESVVLAAQASLARGELDLARARQQAAASRQHLAALWDERSPTFEVAGADPLALPEIADFVVLTEWLERTPELRRFVDERRIREARLQLARSDGAPDLDWQIGVRRFQDAGDVGLVGSISIPLGSTKRVVPAIRAAQADLASLEVEREAKGMSLYSTLAEAHGRYRVAQLEVERLRDDVLPRLVKAESATQAAYRAGAASYLEWTTLQAECTATRRQQLESALDAQRVLIEIQRLTGQAFVAGRVSRSTQGANP